MCQIIIDPTKKDALVNVLTNGPEVKEEPAIIDVLKTTVNTLEKQYNEFFGGEKKYFEDLKASQTYVTITNYTLPKIPSLIKSTTPPTQDLEQKKTIIKNLYASQNLNTDSTFNGKVTFN